jgi:hypothetical protein
MNNDTFGEMAFILSKLEEYQSIKPSFSQINSAENDFHTALRELQARLPPGMNSSIVEGLEAYPYLLNRSLFEMLQRYDFILRAFAVKHIKSWLENEEKLGKEKDAFERENKDTK